MAALNGGALLRVGQREKSAERDAAGHLPVVAVLPPPTKSYRLLEFVLLPVEDFLHLVVWSFQGVPAISSAFWF